MKIRRVLVAGLAAGAFVLAGCTTGESSGGGGDGGDGNGGSGGGGGDTTVSAEDTRTAVITPTAPGDS